jgi:hypothetical protein
MTATYTNIYLSWRWYRNEADRSYALFRVQLSPKGHCGTVLAIRVHDEEGLIDIWTSEVSQMHFTRDEVRFETPELGHIYYNDVSDISPETFWLILNNYE